jgi:hypothetical protein
LVAGQFLAASATLVFDASPAPSLYWVGTQGLSWCSAVAPGGSCTPSLLVAGVSQTNALAVDDTYVYYLEGMVLYRALKG